MTLAMLRRVDPDSFPREQVEEARAAIRALARANRHSGVRVGTEDDRGEQQTVMLPAQAVRLLTDILGYLADGRGVSIMPDDAALTTNQAADLLNVSRPYLIRLLERQEMPFTLVGSHRRVLLRDVLAYHRKQAAASKTATY